MKEIDYLIKSLSRGLVLHYDSKAISKCPICGKEKEAYHLKLHDMDICDDCIKELLPYADLVEAEKNLCR